jgi:hypothetical protein
VMGKLFQVELSSGDIFATVLNYKYKRKNAKNATFCFTQKKVAFGY